ncbi:MAG: hypothetical protein ABW170_04035 [Candidatus Thiodiazotropha sp. L084R]
MFSKILLTMAVIGLAWFVVRHRQQRVTDIEQTTPAVMPKSSNRPIKWLSYGVLALMVAGSLFYFGSLIQQGYRLVTVKVIDAQSGRSVSYIARRKDVDDRYFTTQDGREILVADGERIELSPLDGDRLP